MRSPPLGRKGRVSPDVDPDAELARRQTSCLQTWRVEGRKSLQHLAASGRKYVGASWKAEGVSVAAGRRRKHGTSGLYFVDGETENSVKQSGMIEYAGTCRRVAFLSLACRKTLPAKCRRSGTAGLGGC